MKLVTITLSLLVLAGCGNTASVSTPAVTPNNPYASSGPNLYVYGDSISFGLTHPTYDELFTVANGLNLVQKSVGGTSLYVWSQYAAITEYDTWETDAIIMYSPGANDAVLFEDDKAYQDIYRQGIHNVLKRFKDSGNKVYFGTPNHSCNPNRFYGPDYILDEYAQINRDEYAKINAKNITLVDYASNFKPTPDNTLDCYHPNPIGYQEMYAILLQAVQQ